MEIFTECTWYDFPKLAETILKQIDAKDIQNLTSGTVVDCHWYQFTWDEKIFRLIFEEWPRQCVVEVVSSGASIDELLVALKKIRAI